MGKNYADSVKTPLHEVKINPLDCGWSINEALYQVEDPYILPLPMLATYRAISNSGIKLHLMVMEQMSYFLVIVIL